MEFSGAPNWCWCADNLITSRKRRHAWMNYNQFSRKMRCLTVSKTIQKAEKFLSFIIFIGFKSLVISYSFVSKSTSKWPTMKSLWLNFCIDFLPVGRWNTKLPQQQDSTLNMKACLWSHSKTMFQKRIITN